MKIPAPTPLARFIAIAWSLAASISGALAQPAWINLGIPDPTLAAEMRSARGLAYGANTYALLSGDKVLSSRDGEAWVASGLPQGHEGRGIVYFRGLFVVALGGSSQQIPPAFQFIATSPDARTWTRRATPSSNWFTGIAANGEMLLALGTGASGIDAAISADGLVWRDVSIEAGEAGPQFVAGHPELRSFVAWGRNSGSTLWQTRDGLSWRKYALPGADPALPPLGVAAAGGQFVAAARLATGQVHAFYSSDGLAWTRGGEIPMQPRADGYGLAASTDYGPGRGALVVLAVENAVAGASATTWLRLLEGSASTWGSVGISANSAGSPQFRTTWVGYANGMFFVVDRGLSGTFSGLSRFRHGPQLTQQPAESTIVAAGAPVILSVAAAEAGVTYQWRRNGVDLPGATAPTLALEAVRAEHEGAYVAVVRDQAGRTTASTPATVALRSSAHPARIVNLSVLTALASGEPSFKLGTVVGGAGTRGLKPLVVRAVGPSLAAFGVGDAETDTYFSVQQEGATSPLATSDNWGGAAPLADTMARVGAFALASPSSLDAATALVLPASSYTVDVARGVGSIRPGRILAELYDATPEGSFTPATPRLINVSILKQLGEGLTVGFVIGGAGAKTVLVRAVGPGLAPFGVVGAVADPRLVLFDSAARQLAVNEDWGGLAAVRDASAQVGAFALPPASKDAALLATLEAGSYTVQASGANATTGAALVEVYEVP